MAFPDRSFTGGDHNDTSQLIRLPDEVPPVNREHSHARFRSDALHADHSKPRTLLRDNRSSTSRRSNEISSVHNFASLINDVEDRLFAVLPDDTWFYPGHGDDSTIGKERPSPAEWHARGR